MWESVGIPRHRKDRKNTHMTPTLLHAIGEKLSCKIDVQRLIKKDQVMIVNIGSFCCGRKSSSNFATPARDLPQAFCLLVRGEVERLMTNSNNVFTSISATPFPGIKAKTKFAFRVIYFTLGLFQCRVFFRLENKFFSPFQKATPQKKRVIRPDGEQC